jgi:hypothetical protein
MRLKTLYSPIFLLFVILPFALNGTSIVHAEFRSVPAGQELLPDPRSMDLDRSNPRLPVNPVRVYVDAMLTFPVTKQPAGNPGYVSSEPGVVTEFALANAYNTIGLLAHNTLAGAEFTRLQPGQTITLIYEDNTSKAYQVVEVEHYQALSPNSPYSDFQSLDTTHRRLSASDLFYHVYAPGQRLILQTCIAANGNPAWGRLFVIAIPKAVPPVPISIFEPVVSMGAQGNVLAR